MDEPYDMAAPLNAGDMYRDMIGPPLLDGLRAVCRIVTADGELVVERDVPVTFPLPAIGGRIVARAEVLLEAADVLPFVDADWYR